MKIGGNLESILIKLKNELEANNGKFQITEQFGR